MGILPNYWGNLFWGIYAGGRGSWEWGTFSGPSTRGSIRFTSRGGTIIQVDLNLEGAGGNFRIGIMRDANGVPNEVWEGDTIVNLYEGCPENDNVRWYKIPIGNVVVAPGEVVHVVIQPEGGVTMYAKGVPPNQKMRPFNLLEDPMFAPLWNTGAGWYEPNGPRSDVTCPFRDDVLKGVSPGFVISYSDGGREGQPYHTTWNGMHVYTGSCHGEKILAPMGMLVDRIGFIIGRFGTPTSPLYLSIYDIDASPPVSIIENLEFATLAEVSDVGGGGTWIEKTVTIELLAGKRYEFVFRSTTDSANAWFVLTEGAFGPYGEKDLTSYRMGINFGGFDCCKAAYFVGCALPGETFYPDDLPFFLHYQPAGVTHVLSVESSPINEVPFTVE